jgi:hypothetical protein
MKIAICTHLSLSYMGGGEREMVELANELARRGHEVEFYSLPFLMGSKPKVDPHRILEGVPYHEGWTHKIHCDVAYTFYHPLSTLNFRVKGKRIASFHSQAFFLKSVSPRYGLIPAAASYGTRLIGPLELRAFDAMHTHFPQPTVKHRRTYIIPGWVDTDVFRPSSEKYDQFTVLFSGRALWQKGWDIYVNLARRMKGLGIRFLYVGGLVRDSVIQSLGFQWNAASLSRIYTGSHVLLNPVRVDTFGRVAIESMACLPYDTLVSSPTSIFKYHNRLFDGSLVTVETERGKSLTLTSNHPLLTTRGWIPGGLLTEKDILVTVDESSMDAARIGDLVEGTRRVHIGRSRGASWQDGSQCQVSGTRYSPKQDTLSDEVQIIPVDRSRASLPGRHNRWRGDDYCEEVASWSEATSWLRCVHSDCELVAAAPGLAASQVQLPFGTSGAMAESPRLSIRHNRLCELRSPAEGSSTIHGDKAHSLQSDAEIHGDAHESAGEGPSLGAVAQIASLYPMAKLEAIASIRHEAARNLRVYNLSTVGGHYSANGIVVHNCGTPVVTTPSVAHVGLNLPFVFGNSLDEYEASVLQLKKLWEDGRPYRQLSQRCNLAAQAFSFANTVSQYEKMFSDVVHGV